MDAVSFFLGALLTGGNKTTVRQDGKVEMPFRLKLPSMTVTVTVAAVETSNRKEPDYINHFIKGTDGGEIVFKSPPPFAKFIRPGKRYTFWYNKYCVTLELECVDEVTEIKYPEIHIHQCPHPPAS